MFAWSFTRVHVAPDKSFKLTRTLTRKLASGVHLFFSEREGKEGRKNLNSISRFINNIAVSTKDFHAIQFDQSFWEPLCVNLIDGWVSANSLVGLGQAGVTTEDHGQHIGLAQIFMPDALTDATHLKFSQSLGLAPTVHWLVQPQGLEFYSLGVQYLVYFDTWQL